MKLHTTLLLSWLLVPAPVLAAQQAIHVELLSRATRAGTAGYSGIWGWVDPVSGRELALLGVREGTWIVEVTDPRNPVERGYVPGPVTTFNREITTYKNFAYVVTEGGGGVQVIDLSNPSSPRHVRDVVSPAWLNTHTVVVDHQAGTLWCSGTNAGLLIFDIATDPGNPNLLTLWTTRYVHDTYLHGDYAYLSLVYNDELWIMDKRNLPALTQVAVIRNPMGRTHTAWTDTRATVLVVTADLPGGLLQIYDITNKTSPVPLGSWSLPGSSIHNFFITDDKIAHLVFINGDYRALDISDPRNPREFASYRGIQGWGSYVYQPSGLIYVSDITSSTGGLLTMRLTCGAPGRYGPGTPGTGSVVPAIDWGGGVARVGNTTFRIDGRDLRGGAVALLAVGGAAAGIDVLGIRLLVSPAPPFVMIPTVASAAGTSSIGLPIPNDAALAHAAAHAQWIVLDPGAPQGLAASPGMRLAICP